MFVYGTLLHPEVVEAVVGRPLAAEPARLAGWARRALHDRVYPGLVPRPDEATQGALCRGVDASALARLDRFEGRIYERRELAVETAAGGVPAWVYVLTAEAAPLVREETWDPEAFRARHLARYLAAIRGHGEDADGASR